MRKFFSSPIPYVFIAIVMFICGCVTFQTKKQTNAINYLDGYTPVAHADELLNAPIIPIKTPVLGDFTIYGKSDTRDDDLIITFSGNAENNFNVNYTIIGNDMPIFEEFNKAFKEKYTSQTAIGKLVCISLTSENQDVKNRIDIGFHADVSIWMPTSLLTKEHSVVTADSPSLFKATDDFTTDENYIKITDYRLVAENYICLIYNNAYKIVWICLSIFVVILALCIVFKIRKMRKEDPDYYAGLKREKEQKKYYKQKQKEKMKQQQQQQNHYKQIKNRK